jgi:hypothetical protein
MMKSLNRKNVEALKRIAARRFNGSTFKCFNDD